MSNNLKLCPFCNKKEVSESYDTDTISVSHCGDEACEALAWNRYEDVIDSDNLDE